MEAETENANPAEEKTGAKAEEKIDENLGEISEVRKEEPKKEKANLLEFGEYRMFGPDNGDILIDRIELKSVTGANRMWKVKFIDQKQILLEVVKFG